MEISEFGKKFSQGAGILSLMQDLGQAVAGGDDAFIMMGGGNPGFIRPFHEKMMLRLKTVAEDSELCKRLTGSYSAPQGDPGFINALSDLLRRQLGWQVGPENICITNGSQTAFFMLFNIFAGKYSKGREKSIRLPLTPEYIGYADIGISGKMFTATRPMIEDLGDNFFKYHVDFDTFVIGEETGAICVSRPTNPTGNVVTDEEMMRLDVLAREAGVPLIIDCAYGLPFPGIVFGEAQSFWNENIVCCLSLSKLGLPGTRTGIIVAAPGIIEILSGMNAIMALAPAGFGSILVQEMITSGEITDVSRNLIRPFYLKKAEAAVVKVKEELAGLPFRIHRPEGAMFLWLWFENLPISSLELYERLKRRGVLIISGHYFFPGLEDDQWRHKDECIRVTYSQDDKMVAKGIEIIGEEVRRAYGENRE